MQEFIEWWKESGASNVGIAAAAMFWIFSLYNLYLYVSGKDLLYFKIDGEDSPLFLFASVFGIFPLVAGVLFVVFVEVLFYLWPVTAIIFLCYKLRRYNTEKRSKL